MSVTLTSRWWYQRQPYRDPFILTFLMILFFLSFWHGSDKHYFYSDAITILVPIFNPLEFNFLALNVTYVNEIIILQVIHISHCIIVIPQILRLKKLFLRTNNLPDAIMWKYLYFCEHSWYFYYCDNWQNQPKSSYHHWSR